eukprot:TRINITY_DN10537_c0_g1_i3.p1 TRINITY_DN10537_c0_g1~~TRINITY_DN10537_c0_g1_i3.p1  ORF type:complete len:898 (+),score=130.54 TRINITY_DN10537_c0_g1_i3:125-2818(+)
MLRSVFGAVLPPQAKPGSSDIPRRLAGGGLTATPEDASGGGRVSDVEPFERLLSLTSVPSSHPFLRPLEDSLSSLRDRPCILDENQQHAAAAIDRACELLLPSLVAERRLEFALAAQSDEAASRELLCSIEGALAILLRPTDAVPRSAPAMLVDWTRKANDFVLNAKKTWELFLFFVFLDVKGDQTLCEHTAEKLCDLLACSTEGLAESLTRTKPWVEAALRALAGQQHAEPLQRALLDGLREWRSRWLQQLKSDADAARLSFAAERSSRGQAFWALHFSSTETTSWADFVEAFVENYLYRRCPVDILSQLRTKVDPAQLHRVSFMNWQKLLAEYDTVESLIDVLISEVSDDIAAWVYRVKPLPQLNPCSSYKRQSHGSCTAGGEDEEQMPSTPKQRNAVAENSVPDVTSAGSCKSSSTIRGGGAGRCPRQLLRPEAQVADPFQDPSNKTVSWDAWCAQAWAANRPFWASPQEAPTYEDTACEESLRTAALRHVSSSIAYTNRALLLSVLQGKLADEAPVMAVPASATEEGVAERQPDFPSIVVSANDSAMAGVTRFGRAVCRGRQPLPDVDLQDAIASRCHFSILFDGKFNRYQVADTGSQWGTFMGSKGDKKLSCGDWLRMGDLHLCVRHCGGGCRHRREHAAYQLPSQTQSRRPMQPGGQLRQDLISEYAEQQRMARLGLPLQDTCDNRSLSSCSSAQSLETDDEMMSPHVCRPPQPLDLEVMSGTCIGDRLLIGERRATLGCGAEATIQVSREEGGIADIHCIFVYSNGRWRVRDNDSSGGTWLRMSRMMEPSKAVTLQSGATLLAGNHRLSATVARMTYWWAPSAGARALRSLRSKTEQERSLFARRSPFVDAARLAQGAAATLKASSLLRSVSPRSTAARESKTPLTKMSL